MITAMGLKVDPANMPSCLTAQQFDDWIKRFARVGRNFCFVDISALIPTLTVRFSAEEKKKTYGVFSMQEAKEEIRTLFPRDEGVRERLEGLLAEIETREQLWNNAEGLAYRSRLGEDFDARSVYARIREIASATKFSHVILGEYFHGRREIVLYANSILQTVKNRTAEQAFEEVFAHELFHAYHYFYLHDLQNDIKDADILSRTDKTCEVAMESLASYYENAYCEEYRFPVDLRDVWYKNEPAIYPYAGAKYIQNDREFEEILRCSSDLDAALRKLLFKSDEGRRQFYMIKNGDVAKKIKEGKTTPLNKKAPCPKSCIDAVIEYCREKLNATVPNRGIHYFVTQKMCAFFARHGEEIGAKLRIVCEKEEGNIVIFLDMKGKDRTSPVLELLCSDKRFRAFCERERTADSFRVTRRVTVIDVDALTDEAGRPRPLSDVAQTIDANLQEFQKLLSAFENILDSL